MKSDTNKSSHTNEVIIAESIQCLSCDIPAIITVLLLPISMILLANSETGMFIGSILLILILYGIFMIYNKLHNKKMILTNYKIILKTKEKNSVEEQEFTYDQLKTFNLNQTLLNKAFDIGTITLEFPDYTFYITNIKNPKKFQEILSSKK